MTGVVSSGIAAELGKGSHGGGKQEHEYPGFTRWGVVGAGKISEDFVKAVHTLDAADHRVVAVAARDKDRAEEFAGRLGIGKAYGSHEELAEDPDTDICYIGAINIGHVELCKLMMDHGKHVLCEKPLALSSDEVRELVDFAKAKQVFFMEAMWARFNPTYVELEKRLFEEKYVGDILHVSSTLGLPIADVPRIADPKLGGGTLLDIGEYCLHLAMLCFPKERPEKIISVGRVNDLGVDTCGSVVISYPPSSSSSSSQGQEQRTASFTYSALGLLPNEGFVTGTKAILKLQEPFWASEVLQDHKTKHELFRVPSIKLDTNFVNSYILRYEADECRRCIKQGLKENPRWTWDDTLLMHEMMDKIHEQLGVVYTTANPEERAGRS